MKSLPVTLSLLALILLPKVLLAQELEIYTLIMSDRLISLTENYPFYKYEDSSVISEKYLGNIPIDSNLNNIALTDESRAAFLRRMEITESDWVHIYNYVYDTLITYQVTELNLIASLSPYGRKPPIPDPYYYMIGLRLKDNDVEALGPYYSSTFIYIGKENPFVTGGLQPLEWINIDEKLFPSWVGYKDPLQPKFNEHDFKDHVPGETFEFEIKNMKYFLRNLYLNKQLDARHLIVIDSQIDSVVFNNVYFGSEGIELSPIRLSGVKNEYAPIQWTGELFHNKPPVIFGFLSSTFGCPLIYFLSPEENPISVLCDNRH